MDLRSLGTLIRQCKDAEIDGIGNRNQNTALNDVYKMEPITPTNKVAKFVWLVYGLNIRTERESNLFHLNELFGPVAESANGISSGQVKLGLKFNFSRNGPSLHHLQLEYSFYLYYGPEMEGIISKIQIFGNNGRQISSEWLHCRSCFDSSISQYSFFTNSSAFDLEKPFDYGFIIPELDVEVQVPGYPASTVESYRKSIVIIVEFIQTQPVTPIKSPCTTCVPFIEHQRLRALLTIGKLFNDKEFADVEIIVGKSGEEQTMMAHKAVLAARSSVFKAMLQSRMKENTESKIEITDMEADTFHELLKYLYTAEADFGKYAIKLFECSDKYDIKELNKDCQDFIVQNIASFKWAELFQLIDTYGERFSVLTSGIKDYYERNAMTLKKEGDFQNAILALPEVFVRLHCE